MTDHDYELDELHVLGEGKKRKMTDVVFCILFVAMLLGFATTIGYTFAVGDLGKVAMPIDRDGNFCGKPKGYIWNVGQKERFFFKILLSIKIDYYVSILFLEQFLKPFLLSINFIDHKFYALRN